MFFYLYRHNQTVEVLHLYLFVPIHTEARSFTKEKKVLWVNDKQNFLQLFFKNKELSVWKNLISLHIINKVTCMTAN